MEERRETEKIEAAEQTAVKPAGTEQTAVKQAGDSGAKPPALAKKKRKRKARQRQKQKTCRMTWIRPCTLTGKSLKGRIS